MRQFSKFLAVIWLALLMNVASAQNTIGGTGTISGTLTCLPPASSNNPVFSPAPGTYGTSQSVTISCPIPGQTPFYRTDGGYVSIASPMYTSPITVSSTQTIAALCATIGGTTGNPTYQTNLQTRNTGTGCGTALGGTWSPWTCEADSGVGTVNPSNLTWTFGSTETAEITAPASTSSEVQALFKRQFGGGLDPSASNCDGCTEQVKDIKFTVIGSGMANQENDMPQFDQTHGNTDRQNGTQCQGYGTGAVIAVDSGNAGGHWTTTTIPCSTWTAGTTHEIVNRVDHDLTGSCPGGNGCALYKYWWQDGTYYAMGGNYSNTQGYNNNSGSAWGWQFQPDMKPTSSSPVTGGWTILSSTVALGYGDETSTVSANYTISTGVPSPTMSVSSGAVTPGSYTAATDSLSGSTILYTWDSTTPTYTTLGGQIVPAGTTKEYRVADYPTGFSIYGPRTFKLIAVKSGFTDSSVVSYTYSLTAPTGTALSACGTLASGTTYYVTTNVSSSGTCFVSGGNNWKLNLNGHTVTYGTGHTALVSSTTGVTNGTTTITCSGCAFTSGMVGDSIGVNDLGLHNVQTTIATYVSPTQVTLASAAGWSESGNRIDVWAGSPVFGIQCDANLASGCLNSQAYNGSIIQASNINPQSVVVELGSPEQFGDNANNVISDITFNANSQDTNLLLINASPTTYGAGDLVQFNHFTSTSTVISNRDQFYGTPILVTNTGGASVTSPVSWFNDNVFTESPQGSFNLEGITANVINNEANAGTNIEYVGGYGVFLGRSGSLARGNHITGWQRGLELECANDCTMDQNVVNTTDSANVHDPGHNPVGCEIAGNDAFRVKNYGEVSNACLGNYTSNIVSNNILQTTANACPAQSMRFSQMNSGDTGTIENNQTTVTMAATATISASANYSVDSGGLTCQEYMNGYTFSGNTQTVSGPYSSTGYTISFDPGGGSGWTQGNFISPIINSSAPSGLHSGGTFTGSGSAVMHCNGTDTPSVTYNSVTVPCT